MSVLMCPVCRQALNLVANSWQCEKGHHVHFGIPEIMPLVSLAGKALRGDAAKAVLAGGLQQLVQIEADGAIGAFVALHSHF